MSIRLKPISALALMSAALLLPGCATVVNGQSQTIHLKSKPNHASVSVDGKAMGKTPTTLALERSQDHTVRVALPGYTTTEFALKRRLSGWFLGNVFLGGIVGFAVDAVTGAMYSLTPEELAEYAETTQINYRSKKNELLVILTNSADPKWRKVGQLHKA